jgi:hypothetical protein
VSGIALISFSLLLANRSWADAVADWHGVSPLWSLVPFAVLVAHGVREDRKSEQKAEKARRETDELRRQVDWLSIPESHRQGYVLIAAHQAKVEDDKRRNPHLYSGKPEN